MSHREYLQQGTEQVAPEGEDDTRVCGAGKGVATHIPMHTYRIILQVLQGTTVGPIVNLRSKQNQCKLTLADYAPPEAMQLPLSSRGTGK